MAAASFDGDVPRHGGAPGTGPLGVHAASRKIGKPGGGGGHGQQERKPVIIYMVSPKVIHVEAHEFMPLVQRLTGPGAGRGDRKGRPSPPGLMFHDLSPLRGAALKGEHHPMVSPGWLHHVGDHFLSPGAGAALGSPAASFLDIFGPL